MKEELFRYIKIGIGFYIGYTVAKAVDETLGTLLKQK